MARSQGRDMVNGMGLGMKVLELLVQEVRAQGGNDELIPFLTRPRFKENLTRVAKTIVECEWRVPSSEVRTLAERLYRSTNYIQEAFLGDVRQHQWTSALYQLGIPFERYGDNSPPIPTIFLELLDQKEMVYPLLIDKWVLMNWRFKDKTVGLGDVIDATQLEAIAVAEQKYFDFEK